MAAQLGDVPRRGGDRAEHLLPQRERRRRFRHRPGDVRAGSWPAAATACSLPIIAKLTPNVTSIAEIAKAAEAGGADAISLINTCLGMAVDWRRRRPLLGNVHGRPERAGDQADRPAVRVPGGPGGEDADRSASAASPRSTT